ncbi:MULTISPECIES: type 1 glutamine amidotransferase domain-containing protein [unclassified Streptomyces]|uniref:type 1 glutamine amidotransferase domain-containing protein n=1 Tax=unclassified Streptomyces TaxID=2593676 RepID=UPI002365D413|nr:MULTISPECIES: type 1 glutamine amidotransferase domain-containing protein [unclassified Streptomyces]MDF3143719.1 type 1 glutamine amidotransferase domain-containing protein [Streptomyces sp. T21Q-yed]WDF38863.1 type 1 glutamine amidotransferase domain-containing protein [Streptomyces sp. T12]
MSRKNRILVIVTSTGEYETVGYRTGLWLGELTHFYDVAEQAGFDLTIASIEGGPVPLDPESLTHDIVGDLGTDKRYTDRQFMDKLQDTVAVSETGVDDYDAVYLTGGHGVMFDFYQSQALETVIARFYETGRIVSAVCHGPCGLLDVTLSNGEPLVKGKNVTGFSWREEELAQRDHAVPYSLEDRLKELGAFYSIAEQPFGIHVVEDGRLITGQNPGSAKAVAEAVVRHLG